VTEIPEHELKRSPASAAIGREAERSRLLMSHFEYRVSLEVPEHWIPEGRPDLGTRGAWQRGTLPESKYASFRNDLQIGSYHPGHRAKWTAHELCHGLVGFAWRADAAPLFHALAARLAELVPVALFYFFDEAHLNRCPDHKGGGPLFGQFCKACEEAAASGPLREDPEAERFIREGKAFIDRELTAVHRSTQLGRPISSPWANLDLCSDGLAYAAAQGPRLSSPEMHHYIESFFPEHSAWHASLEALSARIEAVVASMVDGKPLVPWRADADLYMARDLGWRCLETATQCDREVSDKLTALVTDLAGSPTREGILRLMEGYRTLYEAYVLPEPEDVFSVGYPLPDGSGRSNRQIAEGIASACPFAWETLGGLGASARDALVVRFVEADRFERTPLGYRFARWAAAEERGLAARIAAVEAGIAHAPPPSLVSLSLGSDHPANGMVMLDPAVQLFRTDAAVAVALGLASGEETAGRQIWLAMRREVDGEMVVLNLSDDLGDALSRLGDGPKPRTGLGLEADLIEVLENARLICPTSWRVRSPGRD